ncbi:MAG: helix-turn-helix transcriptional regulator [Candidatus Omnitrophica bacterium]|nr:helix-turn-helix transcriptional regulator [Candidatus Omnitrophota bacterium]
MLQIGTQIQRLRKLRKISLAELSKQSGVQIATLSRIENGKMVGTVESHHKIALALGANLSEFYQSAPEETPSPLTAKDKLEIIPAPNDKVSTEILVRQPASKKMLPTIIRLQGKASTGTEKGVPGTERFIFVIDGTVLVRISDQEVKLTKNASLYLTASQPHSFVNPGSAPVKILSVTTPVVL